jgi:hypothetical protein
MRAEILVATHTNTDFDAFAAMLAARRLYPGSVVCLAGSLNRNVREFYRLHADELDFVVDASRLELDAVRRLIVVETVHPGRLGELEPLALDPAVDKVVFDHHGEEELPDWAPAENVVISEDGALTTTLVGVLAEREVSVSPLEATVFALGIHEDTGSLTHTTTTQRDAEALEDRFQHVLRVPPLDQADEQRQPGALGELGQEPGDKVCGEAPDAHVGEIDVGNEQRSARGLQGDLRQGLVGRHGRRPVTAHALAVQGVRERLTQRSACGRHLRIGLFRGHLEDDVERRVLGEEGQEVVEHRNSGLDRRSAGAADVDPRL